MEIILPTIELKYIRIGGYFTDAQNQPPFSREAIYIKVGNPVCRKILVYNFTNNLMEVADETTQVVPLTNEFKIDIGYFDGD